MFLFFLLISRKTGFKNYFITFLYMYKGFVCVCVSVKSMFKCLILTSQFFPFIIWTLKIIHESPSSATIALNYYLSHNPMRAISVTCSYFLNQFQTEFIRMHRSLKLTGDANFI